MMSSSTLVSIYRMRISNGTPKPISIRSISLKGVSNNYLESIKPLQHIEVPDNFPACRDQMLQNNRTFRVYFQTIFTAIYCQSLEVARWYFLLKIVFRRKTDRIVYSMVPSKQHKQPVQPQSNTSCSFKAF